MDAFQNLDVMNLRLKIRESVCCQNSRKHTIRLPRLTPDSGIVQVATRSRQNPG